MYSKFYSFRNESWKNANNCKGTDLWKTWSNSNLYDHERRSKYMGNVYKAFHWKLANCIMVSIKLFNIYVLCCPIFHSNRRCCILSIPTHTFRSQLWCTEGGQYSRLVIMDFCGPVRKSIITRLRHNGVQHYLKSGLTNKSVMMRGPLYRRSIIRRRDCRGTESLQYIISGRRQYCSTGS